ncbi:MBL fold metallo-hydrolase [Acidiphilium acidophilum]|uniref:MBL fold metallo-hydrolase n=1 Tax=Acidiphilium acidophilum TaxID=76588 RepID=UPI002E8E762F|nr:MBL fold metallo-hydrolase [Acidiphilium acidophilum]
MQDEVMTKPEIQGFFDEPTNTVSYVVRDPASTTCAVIDSVLDFDAASGRTSTDFADRIIAFVKANGLTVEWVLETHVHADHLSAAPYIQQALGGKIGIGANITIVQGIFGKIFNAGTEFERDGSQFDRLFSDGDRFTIGSLQGQVMHTPGHTPACMTWMIGDAAFVGDTLFMPDYGTARCDFPGGDARTLYRSIQKIFALPPETRLFMCHDYRPVGRDVTMWESSVAAEKSGNVHVHDGITEDAFVAMREARDATLGMPRLILPSIQVNMRAGDMPPAEDNGTTYLKIPVNML